MVENLLSITRIGNESAKITKEPEAAEEVLDEAVRKFRKRFPAVSVEVHVPDELLLVPMDAILIMQVLSNLMENAVFHGGTTTHIALSAQRDGPWARFYVQDNGQGIPPQKLHTLFSGALRCEDSSPGDGKRNMGLGLSVCMAIIRAHGGTLEAKNLESGAEFSFCLPLTKEEVS
ncbi:MAG: sensor histidine kinase [Dysosmobacter welbionis]